MEKLSFSQLNTWLYCPLSYKLRYQDELFLEPDNTEANNPLIIGSALHKGIEEGVDAALELYDSYFPLCTDKHIEEKIKLESLVPKAQQILPAGQKRFEYHFLVSDFNNFEGYIDLLVKKSDGTFELYDFKYSSNVDKYEKSPQIHMYRYALEHLFPMMRISQMGYLMVPKIQIRLKKLETVEQFRQRLFDLCDKAQPYIKLVEYNEQLAKDSLQQLAKLEFEPTYPPVADEKACRFCQYAPYCFSGDINVLNIKQKRDVSDINHIRVLMYGVPYSGKTFAAQTFPAPVVLNTDGNVNTIDVPYIPIRESAENGLKKNGWTVLKETVQELLETPGHCGFQTIVVDLVDGCYELCRLYMYKKLNITHESDQNLVAWDKVRTEFYSLMNNICSSDMNVVLISHEDASRDLMSRNGAKITAIKPNLHEKVAVRLSSMVDMTMRLVNDNGTRFFSFRSDIEQFGGCRLGNPPDRLPANYQALMNWIMQELAAKAVMQQPIPQQPGMPPVMPAQMPGMSLVK